MGDGRAGLGGGLPYDAALSLTGFPVVIISLQKRHMAVIRSGDGVLQEALCNDQGCHHCITPVPEQA